MDDQVTPQEQPEQPELAHSTQGAPQKHRKAWKELTAEEKRRTYLGCGIVCIGAILLLAVCSGIYHLGANVVLTVAHDDATATASAVATTPSPRATTTQPPTPKPTPTPAFAHFGDGTFQVGKDIQPGTYRMRAASDGCYWERMKDFTGSLDSIIANDNPTGPAVVTIAPTDAGFTSRNCGTWTEDLSAITQSQTSFGEGTFIVGTDIQPGTYKNDSANSCYWARLSGFTGSVDSIIANDNPTATTVVTITPTDKGFTSHGCGTWTKMS